MTIEHGLEPPHFWHSRFGIGLVVLEGVDGYFLWTEHRPHLAGAFPYILFLLCPLMLLFMRHGQRKQQRDPSEKLKRPPKEPLHSPESWSISLPHALT